MTFVRPQESFSRTPTNELFNHFPSVARPQIICDCLCLGVIDLMNEAAHASSLPPPNDNRNFKHTLNFRRFLKTFELARTICFLAQVFFSVVVDACFTRQSCSIYRHQNHRRRGACRIVLNTFCLLPLTRCHHTQELKCCLVPSWMYCVCVP
jgi:hypothetical protein